MKSLNDLLADFTPERRAEIERRTTEMIIEVRTMDMVIAAYKKALRETPNGLTADEQEEIHEVAMRAIEHSLGIS